jgi:hypothetical protein
MKKSRTFRYYNKETNSIELYDIVTGKLLALDDDHRYSMVPFSMPLANVIAQRVMEGETLKTITSDPDMPSMAMISLWKRQYPEFKEMMDASRRDRGHYFNDLAIEELKEVIDKDELPYDEERKHKLVISTAMRIAERDNPKDYVPNLTTGPSVDNKIQVVVTGVPEKKKDDNYEDVVLNMERKSDIKSKEK